MEVADFGLGELAGTGLEILVYENNARYCAKELVLFPRQTCPQHRHPGHGGRPGKMETFRCRWGRVFLYLPGPRTRRPRAKAPQGREASYTVWREMVLRPGQQATVPPDTPHWFQAGPRGAIVSEFSSASDDASDIFQDPEIQRMTKIP
jgi:D-lyxose ketol-isomerase